VVTTPISDFFRRSDSYSCRRRTISDQRGLGSGSGRKPLNVVMFLLLPLSVKAQKKELANHFPVQILKSDRDFCQFRWRSARFSSLMGKSHECLIGLRRSL
jgi:hypothetical protein